MKRVGMFRKVYYTHTHNYYAWHKNLMNHNARNAIAGISTFWLAEKSYAANVGMMNEKENYHRSYERIYRYPRMDFCFKM